STIKIIKNHKRNLLSHIFGKNIIFVMFLSRYFTILYRIGILSNGFGSRRTAARKNIFAGRQGFVHTAEPAGFAS
ncbi:hypothetical protein, partial [Neisseria meningitidis]|uniref:hypothetical protein n=5 Tax=Neisseria meningitidis TaxID=487 RepID=UPI001C704C54